MPKSRALTPTTEFCAVDLDVRSRQSLAPLLTMWPWAQTPGWTGRGVPHWLVVQSRRRARSVDEVIRHLVRMVDALPPPARCCWREASSRTFDIGIQAGLSPQSFEDVRLSPTTIQAVGRVRGRIVVTVYAPTKD